MTMLHLPKIKNDKDADKYIAAIREHKEFDSDHSYKAAYGEGAVTGSWVDDYYVVHNTIEAFIVYAREFDMYFIAEYIFNYKISTDIYIVDGVVKGHKYMQEEEDPHTESHSFFNRPVARDGFDIDELRMFVAGAILNGGI